MNEKRAFFIGAGASCADGFPLTSHISYGLANEVIKNLNSDDPNRYKKISRFLKIVFQLTEKDLEEGARCWDSFLETSDFRSFESKGLLIPDIVELLSLLDVLIIDESLIAGHRYSKEKAFRAVTPRELARVRQSISLGVASAFSKLAQYRKNKKHPEVTASFVEKISAEDVLITTNWDLLLDSTLDKRFGTDAHSVGSDVIIVDISGKEIKDPVLQGPRPSLYKLHGSLNWLSCPRCTRLYVNPTIYIAQLGFNNTTDHTGWNSCDCGMPLNAVLITPTYFKQYRNRHLINIWSHAQEKLAQCNDWYFIGYSLPTDDVHIRTLLLRAFHMRKDKGTLPKVHIVTDSENNELKKRFARLFRDVTLFPKGFEEFIKIMD